MANLARQSVYYLNYILGQISDLCDYRIVIINLIGPCNCIYIFTVKKICRCVEEGDTGANGENMVSCADVVLTQFETHIGNLADSMNADNKADTKARGKFFYFSNKNQTSWLDNLVVNDPY